MHDLPTYDDVIAAAARIAGHANRTPVMSSRTLDEELGAEVFFKCENLQRKGAFKFRGAFNALSRFSAEQRAADAVADRADLLLAGRLLDGVECREDALAHVALEILRGVALVGIDPGDDEDGVALGGGPGRLRLGQRGDRLGIKEPGLRQTA